MKRIYLILLLVIFSITFLYLSCNQERENLKILLEFQSQEGGLGNFIEKYANKVVVSVYGNNMTPVKKSVDFPSSPDWICLNDGGYYKPDGEGFYEFDTYFPPSCSYEDRQFARIVLPVSVPIGSKRSIIVETINKESKVTFRGSLRDIDIGEDTSVSVVLNPISKIDFSVFEITDIRSSQYEPANMGKLRAYYFERGKMIDGERKNYATLLGEQDVSRDKKTSLEFAYSGQYYEDNYAEKKSFFYPTLFGYYKGDNGAISFVMPGVAESFGFGLEPGGNYEMYIYAALRDKIRENPILTAVTPSQINYIIDGEYGRWDWMYIYFSYIHRLVGPNIKTIRAKFKFDYAENVRVFSTAPVGDELPFPNEVYDIGRLKDIEDEFYMGFKNIPITVQDNQLPPKNSGDIICWMEFDTDDGKTYKTNEIKIKYNINTITSTDAGFISDGGQ